MRLKQHLLTLKKIKIRVVPNIDLVRDARQFLLWWATSFPMDRWYRSRKDIGIGSEEHLNTSILTIRLEWEEFMLFQKFNNKDEEVVGSTKKYDPASVSPLKRRERVLTDKFIDQASFTENDDGSITFN